MVLEMRSRCLCRRGPKRVVWQEEEEEEWDEKGEAEEEWDEKGEAEEEEMGGGTPVSAPARCLSLPCCLHHGDDGDEEAVAAAAAAAAATTATAIATIPFKTQQ